MRATICIGSDNVGLSHNSTDRQTFARLKITLVCNVVRFEPNENHI